MIAAEMARIHAAAFAPERGWGVADISGLLAQPHTTALSADGGFALIRTVAGETELLTLAVSPAQRRRGIAHALMTSWIETSLPQAERAFLEVAADNDAARALYTRHGFTCTGLRKAYYSRSGAPAVDALLMSRALTRG